MPFISVASPSPVLNEVVGLPLSTIVPHPAPAVPAAVLRHLDALSPRDQILDPFCASGDLILAARRRGIPGLGLDADPLSAAIAHAKAVSPPPRQVFDLAKRILDGPRRIDPDPAVVSRLRAAVPSIDSGLVPDLVAIRDGLIGRSGSRAAALRGALLGLLQPSWMATRPNPSFLHVLADRLDRFYAGAPRRESTVRAFDAATLRIGAGSFALTVANLPPPGGLVRVPGRALERWFIGEIDAFPKGAPPYDDVSADAETPRTRPPATSVADQHVVSAALSKAWRRIAYVSRPEAILVVRMGMVPSSPCDPEAIVVASLRATAVPWRLVELRAVDEPSPWRPISIEAICELVEPLRF